MEILTEINYDCSFMQTIIKLPQTRDSLKSADIDPYIIDLLLSHSNFTDKILKTFNSYQHIKDFIIECKSQNQLFYVKTFPEDKKYNSNEVREYICYGEYHRNIPVQHKNLFFRLDQKWDNFQFPMVAFEVLVFLKNTLPILSGTISTNTNFPSIILEQKELNNVTDLSIDKKILENLYLFSTDYFSKSHLLSKNGDVFEFHSGKLKKSKFDFTAWVDNELMCISNLKFAN